MRANKLLTKDYQRLKTFFECYTDWFIPDSRDSDAPGPEAAAFLESVEKAFLANADKGLQTAIDVIIKMTSHWTPDQVAEADAWLAAAGTFTLSEVRRRYSGRYLQIRQRGLVRSEAEYYLVKGIVDGGGIESGSAEGAKLQAMLEDFEARLVATLEIEHKVPPASS